MKTYQYIIIFLLLVVITFPSRLYYYVVNIPSIIEHYEHHLMEHDENLGFIEYIAIHTFDKAQHDKEHHEDEESPFNTNKNTCSSVQLLSYLVVTESFLPSPFTETKQRESLLKENFYTSSYLSSIWQPPKFS